MKETRSYNSSLRQAQADATRERILEAMAAILEEDGRIEAATNRAVAERAGVREITVYRHFPSREILLRGLWEWMNRRAGAVVGMPETEADLTANLGPLFKTFDASPAHITAAILTAQGRQMRESLNPERQAAFLAAISEASASLDAAGKAKAAGVIQLLHSAYAWISLREQWGLGGEDAADAARWAIDTLLAELRRGGGPKPSTPTVTSKTVEPAS